MLTAGTSVGPYKIVALLGAGGMGEVYRASDARLGREVAVKVIKTDWTRGGQPLQRFEQEARAAGALNHPNVCSVFDVGIHDGSPFVVMELLEGMTLRARLNQGPIPVRKAVDWAAQAAQGLAAAHDKGIVHRDLKPENLFLTKDGRVKVLDFGLAKLTQPELLACPGGDALTVAATQPGTIIGTAGYMAPEQVRGEAADQRTDLFALGAVLYELLTGKRAFPGETLYEILYHVVHDDPLPLDSASREMVPGLEAIVRRCLEKNPAERFQSAKDLAFDLETVRASGSAAAPPAVAGQPRRLARRLLVGALVAPALLAIAFGLGQQWSSPPRPSFRKLSFGSGGVGSARFTPDGNSVAYSARWGDQDSELYSTRVDAPGVVPLGLKAVAVVGIHGGEAAVLIHTTQPRTIAGAVVSSLALVPLGGGTPRLILEDVQRADWSRDGKSFAVVRHIRGRDRVEFPPGRILFETAGWVGSVRISPDGKSVAFSHWPFRGNIKGTIMVADGAGRVRVLAEGAAAGHAAVQNPVWSPDGSEIWYAAGDVWGWMSLRAVSLDGKVRTVLESATSHLLLDVHRDGRALVTSQTTTSEIWGRAPGDTAERAYSWLDGSVAIDLSADGTMLLFRECAAGGGVGESLYLRRLDGSPPMRLGAGIGHARLSPDGAWVYGAWDSSGVLMPTGAGPKRTLPRGPIDEPQAAAWFPDGRRILICGSSAGRPPRLFVQDLEGGDPRPITSEGIWFASPSACISPDGSRIAAISEAGPVMVEVAGGDPRRIEGLRPGAEPVAWAQDGGSLFVVTSREGGVVRVDRLDLASGRSILWKELRLRDRTGASMTYQPLIARDGEVYFYSAARTLGNLYLVEGLH